MRFFAFVLIAASLCGVTFAGETGDKCANETCRVRTRVVRVPVVVTTEITTVEVARRVRVRPLRRARLACDCGCTCCK